MPGMPNRPRIDILLHGFAFSTDQGLPAFCGVFLVEGADRDGRLTRIVVDPAHVGRRVVLWESLAQRKLEPEEVDMVVLTHAHWDHIQNIDVFENAPVLLHPSERHYSWQPHKSDWATPQWTGAIIERMRVREVGEGTELIPGVGIIELPGHSPGSIGVTVDSDAGQCIITGDALHFASIALTKQNPLVFWNEQQARTSIDRVLDKADIIYPGHDQPFRLTKANRIEYVEPLKLTITGVTPQTPGLSFSMESRPPWVMPGVDEPQVWPEKFVYHAHSRMD